MTPASQRTRALSEPEAKRRERARLLIRQFRAKVAAMLQEFRAKFGKNRTGRRYRAAKHNHKDATRRDKRGRTRDTSLGPTSVQR
jgi:hypothetical protein